MTFGWRSSLNLLTCNIWTESDCTTNLFTDYHKLINYEVMMCPNGLIIAFSQTDHIVPCSRRLPHIFSKKKKELQSWRFLPHLLLWHMRLSAVTQMWRRKCCYLTGKLTIWSIWFVWRNVCLMPTKVSEAAGCSVEHEAADFHNAKDSLRQSVNLQQLSVIT